MEIELVEITRGESSSSATESKGKGIEVTTGESSSAASQSNVESTLKIDMNQLNHGLQMSAGPNYRLCEGSYKGSPVVIKRMRQEDKFLREVGLLSKVQHENIVKFIGSSQKYSWTIVTEFMRGGSLKDHLSSIPSPGTLDLKDALTFALGISRAMEYLHGKGIIHRQLKPSNIFLTEDKKTVKVGDFGVCREEVEGNMSPEVGTHPWMAPEVFQDTALPKLLNIMPHEMGTWRPKYNHKADVYSFSLVLWELLTNNNPLENGNDFIKRYVAASSYLRRIPAYIHPLITSCWADDPNKRPEFSEISEILEELLRDIPPTGEILPASESPGRTDEENLTDEEHINMLLSFARNKACLPDTEIEDLANLLCGRARAEQSLPIKTKTSLAKRFAKFCASVEQKAEQ